MIDLTPLEVRKKKGDFRRGIRGYEAPQVDEFLDIVADRLEALVRENIAMKEQIGRLEQQVRDNRDREKALTEALVTAQEMREEVRSQVAREADLLRRQAEQEVESIKSRADQVREREEEVLRRLRVRQLKFVETYRTFLERELSELASVAAGLEMNEGLSTAEMQGRDRSDRGPFDRRGRGAGPSARSDAAPAEPDRTAPVKAGAPERTAPRKETARPAPKPVREAERTPPRSADPDTSSASAAAASDDDDTSWVDDLLAQPALQPVRPSPLRGAPADSKPGGSAPGTGSGPAAALGKERGPAAASAAPRATGKPSAAELILSDDDVAAEDADVEPIQDAEVAVDDAIEDWDDLPTWTVEPVASRPADPAPPAPLSPKPAQARAQGPARAETADDAADQLWDRAAGSAEDSTSEPPVDATKDDEAEDGIATDPIAPADVAPADPAPADVAPADPVPADVAPADAAPADVAAADSGKAAPPDSEDSNLGLSLVPEQEKFQDFGDFSELGGSPEYGLLPDIPEESKGKDVSELTLRPVAQDAGSSETDPDETDASDDDPDDLLSTVFGDGR